MKGLLVIAVAVAALASALAQAGAEIAAKVVVVGTAVPVLFAARITPAVPASFVALACECEGGQRRQKTKLLSKPIAQSTQAKTKPKGKKNKTEKGTLRFVSYPDSFQASCLRPNKCRRPGSSLRSSRSPGRTSTHRWGPRTCPHTTPRPRPDIRSTGRNRGSSPVPAQQPSTHKKRVSRSSESSMEKLGGWHLEVFVPLPG